MAKNGNLFGDIGAELMQRAQGVKSVAVQPTAKAVEQSVINKEEPTVKIENTAVHSNVLQGKQGKQAKKEYNYGTKRTFPIPDELWNDALILMQLQGLKQVEFIQGLIRDAVDSHCDEINTVKRMRGEL